MAELQQQLSALTEETELYQSQITALKSNYEKQRVVITQYEQEL
jgi:hypothetical protein